MGTITWTQTPTLKELTLPSGNTYWFKDDEVRQWIGTGSSSGAEYRISTLETDVAKLSNATHWLGVTTTTLSDGSTTNPITINGQSVTAVSGDIVQDSNAVEYIFNGTAWQQIGSSVGTLKAFAYADTGDVTITPVGTNSSSSVSGTCTVTPSGSIGVGSGTANYTPAGSISTGSGTANYTPAGSCSGTAVTLTSGSVGSVTDAGSMPTYTVSNEVLTITAGAVPTVSSVSVATGVDTVTDPIFSGTGAELKFSGTGAELTFTGSSSSGTISGTASAQTFTGTEATHTVYPTSST